MPWYDASDFVKSSRNFILQSRRVNAQIVCNSSHHTLPWNCVGVMDVTDLPEIAHKRTCTSHIKFSLLVRDITLPHQIGRVGIRTPRTSKHIHR